jgi:hypothetical protein
MIIAVAALPPAAVEGDNFNPAAITVAGWPIFTYDPTIHKQIEQAMQEMMTGLRRPTMSITPT